MPEQDFRAYGIFLLSSVNGFSVDGGEHIFFRDQCIAGNFENYAHSQNGGDTFSLYNNGGKKYIVIPNLHNPRWFVPKQKSLISGIGKIIKPTSLHARLAWKAALFLNQFDHIDWLFPEAVYMKEGKGEKRFINGTHHHTDFVIYTGAPGIYQKFTIQEMAQNGKIMAFYKMACKPFAQDRIRNECAALQKVEKLNIRSFKYPKVMSHYVAEQFTVLKISPCEPAFKNVELIFSSLHRRALTELDSRTSEMHHPSEVLMGMKEHLKKLRSNTDELMTRSCDALERAHKVLLPRVCRLGSVKYTYSHGDFTPWNMYSNREQLFIFDWEMAAYRSQLWDYFNFIYHKHMLHGRFSCERISKELRTHKIWALSIVKSENMYEICHLLFLMNMLVHYIDHHLLMRGTDFKNNVEELVTKFERALHYLLGRVHRV